MFPGGERNRTRTRLDLLDAAVELLLEGEEPTMRGVAARAGVGERTIYRHFEGVDGLRDEITTHLAPKLGAALCDSVDGLEDYACRLFTAFEENHALTVAVVTSPWATPALATTRSRNLRAITVLLEQGYPDGDRIEISAAAASLRTVLSGSGWVYQRESCGLDSAAITASAIWLINTCRERLSSQGRAASGARQLE